MRARAESWGFFGFWFACSSVSLPFIPIMLPNWIPSKRVVLVVNLGLNTVQLYAWLLYHSIISNHEATLSALAIIIVTIFVYWEEELVRIHILLVFFWFCAFCLNLLILCVDYDFNCVLVLISFDFLLETWDDLVIPCCFLLMIIHLEYLDVSFEEEKDTFFWLLCLDKYACSHCLYTNSYLCNIWLCFCWVTHQEYIQHYNSNSLLKLTD